MADLFGGLKSYVLLVLGWCLLLDQATGDWGDKFKDHDLDFKNIEDRIERTLRTGTTVLTTSRGGPKTSG